MLQVTRNMLHKSYIADIRIHNCDIMTQEKKLTEALMKRAYSECKKSPYIPAACLAEKLGFSARYMTQELVKSDNFEFIKIGNMYLFRPKK